MARKLIIDAILNDKSVKAGLEDIKQGGLKAGPAIARGMAPLVAKLAAVAAGAAVVAGAVKLAGQAFAEWKNEEQSIAAVNAALAASNQLTAENLALIRAQGDAVQAVTTLENDYVNNLSAQMLLMGVAAAETGILNEAVLGLSKTYSKDALSLLPQINKLLSGQTDTLSRLGIEVEATATREERLQALHQAGIAGWKALQAETDTYDGALKVLNNSWGDFLEVLTGATGITMPALVEAINGVTAIINIFGAAIQANTASASSDTSAMGSVFAQVFAGIGKGVVITVGVIGSAANGFKAAFYGISAVVASVGASALRGLQALADGAVSAANSVIFAMNSINVFTRLPSIAPIKYMSSVSQYIGILEGAARGASDTFGQTVLNQAALMGTLEKAWGSINSTSIAIAKANTGVGASLSDLAGGVGEMEDAATQAGKAGGAAKKGLDETALGVDNVRAAVDRAILSFGMFTGLLRTAAGQTASYFREGQFDAVLEGGRNQRDYQRGYNSDFQYVGEGPQVPGMRQTIACGPGG